MGSAKTVQRVPVRELVWYYLRLGLIGFGGPVVLAGQMERELVEVTGIRVLSELGCRAGLAQP